MNIHNKLQSLGFRKIKPHHLKGQQFVEYDEPKERAPKWTFTYFLKFSDTVKVWAFVEKHSDVNIYVESDKEIKKDSIRWCRSDDGPQIYINLIYTNQRGYNKQYPPLTSVNDIIQHLPLAIQRDIQLSRLLG